MTATDIDLDALLDALLERAATRPAPALRNVDGDEVSGLATTGRIQVSSGATILASWGNTTYDQTIQCFDTPTQRDQQWPAPHDGAAAYTADTNTLWARRSGVWLPVAVNNLPAPPTTGPLQSFVDLAGDVWIAKPGVYGGAWKKAAQWLRAKVSRAAAASSPTTSSRLPMDTTVWDPWTVYNSGAWGFQIPIDGLYLVNEMVSPIPPASGNQWSQLTPEQQPGSGNPTPDPQPWVYRHSSIPSTTFTNSVAVHLRCYAGDFVYTTIASSVTMNLDVRHSELNWMEIKYQGPLG